MSIGFWVEIVLFSLGNIETYLKHCPKLYDLLYLCVCSDLLKSICTNKIYKKLDCLPCTLNCSTKLLLFTLLILDLNFIIRINKSFILIDFEMCLMDISVNSTKITLIHFSKRDVTPQTIYTKKGHIIN